MAVALMARLNLRTAAVAAKVTEAAKTGVDATMAECVSWAKRHHPWRNVTGFAEASIWLLDAAKSRGQTITGKWGSTARYALPLEIGTSRIGPDVNARVLAADGNMWAIPGPKPEPGVTVRQSFTILPPGTMKDQEDWVTLHRASTGTGPLMSARPYLRPAADVHYRLLSARIRAAFQGTRMP